MSEKERAKKDGQRTEKKNSGERPVESDGGNDGPTRAAVALSVGRLRRNGRRGKNLTDQKKNK
jgi:hypothetical protein